MGGVVSPYQVLAPLYNHIMAHVDYPMWADYLRAAWRRHGRSEFPSRLLELAAGTCPFAASPLFPEAFTLYTELSPAMLRMAPAGARRIACDARQLPLRGPFDLVVMLYDSLNYLLQPEEVLRTFAGVRDLLVPGGLFLFDVTTETCSRRHFSDSTEFEEMGDCDYIRRSRYDATHRLQLNLFTFFLTDGRGGYVRREEIHRQRIYPKAHLKDMARAAGFNVPECTADFTQAPGTDRHDRLHFVLERP